MMATNVNHKTSVITENTNVGIGRSPGASHADENLVNVENEAGTDSNEWRHEILEIEEGHENNPEYNRNDWELCAKNPGHSEFKCVDDIKSHPLLKDCTDDDLFQLIKFTADLTVRIETGFVSQERPQLDPVIKKTYPLYRKRGQKARGCGTGFITDLEIIHDKEEKIICDRSNCLSSGSPHNVLAKVTMTTSKHVVFDQTEAERIRCTLFFDKEDSSAVTLEGWTVKEEDIKEDKCKLTCPICDQGLLDKSKLVDALCKWAELCKSVYERYKDSKSDLKKLIFIVSHPHGYFKKVTVGELIKKSEEEGEWDNCSYEYTTGTCPGSSGAHVFYLGIRNSWCYSHHTHSGVNGARNNFSGIGKKNIRVKLLPEESVAGPSQPLNYFDNFIIAHLSEVTKKIFYDL